MRQHHRLVSVCLVLLLLVPLTLISSCSSSEPVLMELPPPSPEDAPVSQEADSTRFAVLVFSKTTGFRHTAIETGVATVKNLGTQHNFKVDATEDGAVFTISNLAKYNAVIFMNTNGVDVLNAAQKVAFESYIKQGGGYVGVHSASATEYEWPWYGDLVGAYFDQHPDRQTAEIHVLDRLHPSTAHLPERWVRYDEWYNFRTNPRGKVHVLATLNEQSYEGGKMGHDHPIIWAHEFDGGRAWYTGLGHTEESYEEDNFLKHLLGGIEWAAGVMKADVSATMGSRYTKKVLMDQVTDPMEIAISEDGRVFLAERAGAIKMWNPKTQETKDIGWLPVYMVIEDGLLGLSLDPNFINNGWLYVFYAPVDAGPSRLSRFTLIGDQIEMGSEVVLLEIPVQRKDCCHAGGSITFDTAGNLYLSTGDNTNPYDREGSPIDERPGKEYSDAQRTSGNTNDLRGKIIRIHPEIDGTYTIPEGNLFAGDELHRPEIYTMGHRNPFRISVDAETGWLYWGDVGNGDPPNARGGWGWDEFNQARGPGFFGWPYFSGKNQPYKDYDYATETVGQSFNAAAPVNDSPNNTGARELPPAQAAMIAYTYGVSEEFPELGAGGVNPMAGPVFRMQDSYKPGALPAYYDGSLIIYDWMRNWVMEAKLDENGDILDISPFLPGIEFIRPMDMEIGPDGSLYVIEWGNSFWGSNPDARVVRIIYQGNPSTPSPITMKIKEIAFTNNYGTKEEQAKYEQTLPAKLQITSPSNGSFFSFDEPVQFQTMVHNKDDEPLENATVTVSTYSGFDTHRILLNTQSTQQGETTITRAYTHTPDLHFTDRFAELKACTANNHGFTICDTVKLQPFHKEAEHVAWQKQSKRQTHGSHPASERFDKTALTTMQVIDGSALAYGPINLSEVEEVTLRIKQYEAGSLALRANTADGMKLASVTLDASTATQIAKVQQLESVDQALQHDEAILVQGLNREVYENWSEITIPLNVRENVAYLVLTFEGSSDKMLLELDWMRFR